VASKQGACGFPLAAVSQASR